jgi:hypothetical protein
MKKSKLKNKKQTKKRTGRGKVKDKLKKKFKFISKVIVWNGGNSAKGDDSGNWRFARVPEDISAKIKEMQKGRLRRGWGAVYAKAKVGKSEWQTSIFPDRRSATYLLPLKKQIRFDENLYDGDEFTFSIEISF